MADRVLQVRMVSPDGVIWEGPASFVVMPVFDGEMGIAPGHTPLLARLGAGLARIRSASGSCAFVLKSGFLEVIEDHVEVIVDRAEPAGAVDERKAREDLLEMQKPRRRNVDQHEVDFQQDRWARERLRAATRKGGAP